MQTNAPFYTGANLYASTNFGIGTNTANILGFFTNNAERMLITSGGNVGIGTSSPADKLEVYNGSILVNRPSLGNDASHTMFRFNAGTDATLGPLYFAMTGRPSATGANRYVEMYAGDNIAYRNIIFPFANIGIGTTSPNERMTIQSGVSAPSAVTFRANNVTTANELFVGQAAGNEAYFYNRANQQISFGTNNTERMRIFANGRVFIGASPTDGGYQLDVNGNTRVTGKIDVTANASIGHNIIRTGTSDIAAQVFNSNGWLLYGAEGANGGAIFTGSTPYAAVVGSGYNRPLQLATNSAVRMEIDSVGPPTYPAPIQQIFLIIIVLFYF